MKRNRKPITPQKRFHVKKGDEVVVISGANRDKRGKVLQVLREKNRVLVEGVNMIKKTLRKSQENPEGGIIEREGSLPVSNVMLVKTFDARQAKRSGSSTSSKSKTETAA